ncbi:histone-lysine N-methyltransferase SETMAR [Trichonephila clavipes]|nr:histone-lysine N-methyltransferase SETMAR [Trichonephila clavipes]
MAPLQWQQDSKPRHTGLEFVTITTRIRRPFRIQEQRQNIQAGIFDVKDVPRTGRPVVENVDKITEIIEGDQHVSSRSIAQGLKIDHKTVLNHLHKIGLKKKLGVWVQHQ